MNKRISSAAALLLCVSAIAIMLMSGCRGNISAGTNDILTGEEYSDAEKYKPDALSDLSRPAAHL